MNALFSQISNLLKVLFGLSIFYWGVDGSGSNPVFILGSLYVYYLVWEHGHRSGESQARMRQALSQEDLHDPKNNPGT